ncbi:MAG: DUF1501 domain-containing protein [Gammaproteobacteria bacterium]|nr:DUF1501 domain-containing protein [Gammaproteobacteria bacterium]
MNISRRRLLQSTLALSTGYSTAAMARSFGSIAHESDQPPRYLILIELIGGNDGLNTIVPFRDQTYYDQRPNLAIRPDEVVPLREGLGLHPALEPLYPYWEKRELVVLNNVAHDTVVDSHFRAAEIWDTGITEFGQLPKGWVASLIPPERYYREYVALGINVGANPGPMEGGEYMLTMDSLDKFLRDQKRGVDAPIIKDHIAMSHLYQVQANLARSEKIPNNRFEVFPEIGGFTDDELGRGLQDISAMIINGAAAPVLKTSLNGFDTHQNQPKIHADLLARLAHNLANFRELMHETGYWPQVMVMTYSEFGRALSENDQMGTEHGHAAPVLMMSSGIKGDIYGGAPDLTRGEALPFQFDFRQVINTAVLDWLGTRSGQINIRRYPAIDVVDVSAKRDHPLL